MTALSWREFRTSTPKQCLALDFLTNQGQFAKSPLKNPFLLVGGAGYGSKSYCIRTAAVEILLEFRRLGFPNRRVAIFSDNMPNVHQRQSVEMQVEFQDFAVVRGSQIRGQHVEFFGRGWENIGTIALRGMAEATVSGGKRGAQFDAILFDELTLITAAQFGELIYMKRSGAGLPFCPFMGATNPDGIGHDFCKKLWVPGYQDFSEFPDAIKKAHKSFFYIPMLKSDNPGYKANQETVDMNMALIADPEIRRAREFGSWDIYMGGRFTGFNRTVHSFEWADFLARYHYHVPENLLDQKSACERIFKNPAAHGFDIWGSFDYGTSIDSASAFYLHAVDRDRNVWTFLERYWRALLLVPQARLMGEIWREYKPRGVYCDPNLQFKKSESEDGKSRIQMFREADPDVRMRPGNNERIPGWSTFDVLLHYDRFQDPETGRTTIMSDPKWRIHSDCTNLQRQLAGAPRDATRPEDVSSKFKDDHALDSARYLLHTRFQSAAMMKKLPPKGSLAWLKQQVVAERTDVWD